MIFTALITPAIHKIVSGTFNHSGKAINSILIPDFNSTTMATSCPMNLIPGVTACISSKSPTITKIDPASVIPNTFSLKPNVIDNVSKKEMYTTIPPRYGVGS